jgi:hypothetical protein
MPDQENDGKGVVAPDTEEKRAFIKGLVDRGQAERPAHRETQAILLRKRKGRWLSPPVFSSASAVSPRC